ncbi:hypothetical protein C8J57DRAFT_1661080 [Mycena rebaudengoi]|nr:hypothetical protein C8J57DRAFT_1661080 [Mycena rebaudengoi]
MLNINIKDFRQGTTIFPKPASPGHGERRKGWQRPFLNCFYRMLEHRPPLPLLLNQIFGSAMKPAGMAQTGFKRRDGRALRCIFRPQLRTLLSCQYIPDAEGPTDPGRAPRNCVAATATPNEKYESRSRGQSMDRLLDSEPPPTHRHTASASDDTSAPYALAHVPPSRASPSPKLGQHPCGIGGGLRSLHALRHIGLRLLAVERNILWLHHFPLPLGGQPEPDAVVLRALQRTPDPVQHVNAKHASVHIVRMLPTVASAPAVPPLPDTYHYQRTPKLSTTSQISADGQAFAATLPVYGHHRLSSVGEKAMAWPETPGGACIWARSRE